MQVYRELTRTMTLICKKVITFKMEIETEIIIGKKIQNLISVKILSTNTLLRVSSAIITKSIK